MLVTITMATAVNTKKTEEKKESPLYGIRTNRAISEKIQNLKTKFFGNRLFFLPFQWNRNNNLNLRNRLNEKDTENDRTCVIWNGNCLYPTSDDFYTCSNRVTECIHTCRGFTCRGPLCE